MSANLSWLRGQLAGAKATYEKLLEEVENLEREEATVAKVALAPPVERQFSLQDAAKYLSRSERWLYGKAATGEIPSSQDGKGKPYIFRQSDLDAWLAKNRVAPIRRGN